MHHDCADDADARRGDWQIRVDTGGTFTDCIAVDPTGLVHRAKILSNSALRGRVRRRINDRQLAIDENWGLPGELVREFSFHLLGERSKGTKLASYDPDSGCLELAEALPDSARSGAAFELRSAEEAPVLAARIVTSTPPGRSFPPLQMRLGSTRGTNALLERSGSPTVFFVTRGFGDLLAISDQQRLDLFALCVEKISPLYEAVVEVDERLRLQG